LEGRLFNRGSINNRTRSLLHTGGWVITLSFFLFFWLILSSLYPILIPSPSEVATYIINLNPSIILIAIVRTLINSFLGFLLALLLSISLGLVGYSSSFIYLTLEKFNKFIQSVSVLVWVIIAIMVFGVTSSIPPIIVTSMASFPILFSSTISGIKDVDARYYELSRLLEATKLQTFRHIILPGLIPYLSASSRSALGLAIRISVVAEAFGAAGGIGYQLIYSYDLGFKEGVFAWAILLIFLMITLDSLVLEPVERWGMKWMR